MLQVGDEVLYVGLRTKYEGLTGVVRRIFSDGTFSIKFSNGEGGIFSHASSFKKLVEP